MAEMTVEVKGLDELLRKFGKPFQPYIQAMTLGIAESVRGLLANYPGPAAHPIDWASEKQRRWYFANRREQGLPFGYVRNSDPWSQRLGPSWATAKRGSLDAVIGTRATYASRVQEDAKQQPMHKKTGWITDKIALARVKASGIIDRLWKDTVANFFSGRGKL